jgi:hypothetical protein
MTTRWGARYLRRMFLMMATGLALLAIGYLLDHPKEN